MVWTRGRTQRATKYDRTEESALTSNSYTFSTHGVSFLAVSGVLNERNKNNADAFVSGYSTVA